MHTPEYAAGAIDTLLGIQHYCRTLLLPGDSPAMQLANDLLERVITECLRAEYDARSWQTLQEMTQQDAEAWRRNRETP